MSKDKPWRFSESRPIHPFRISEHALSGVGFRTREDSAFSSEEPWTVTIEPEEIASESFEPKLKLTIDEERLCKDTGLAAADLQLSLIARDPALWRAEKIAGWSLGDYPEEYAIPKDMLESFSGARGLQFALQVSPAKSLKPEFRTASSPGHIVARRDFDIAIPGDGSDFPIDLVDPSVFVDRKLPAETVWIVHWMAESDFDLPAEDVLVVLINKDQGDKLLRLSATDTVAAVLWTEIATEIFVEIALVVLRSEPSVPQNKDSLLSKIMARLQRDTGLTHDELIVKSKDTLRATTFLRAHLQKGLELGSRIGRMNLAGRA
jgi:hypothetical protein